MKTYTWYKFDTTEYSYTRTHYRIFADVHMKPIETALSDVDRPGWFNEAQAKVRRAVLAEYKAAGVIGIWETMWHSQIGIVYQHYDKPENTGGVQQYCRARIDLRDGAGDLEADYAVYEQIKKAMARVEPHHGFERPDVLEKTLAKLRAQHMVEFKSSNWCNEYVAIKPPKNPAQAQLSLIGAAT